MAAIALRPHDRVRKQAGRSTIAGVDLVCSTIGIHVSRISGGSVLVRSTLDIWHNSTGSILPGTPSSDSVPTLCVDRRDNVYCFFHTGDVFPFSVVGKLSIDYGNSWQDRSPVVSSHKFPRACCLEDAQFLACHDGSVVDIFRSIDYFNTVDLVFSQSCPLQLVDLCTDRRDTLHLIYQNGGGDLVQSLSKDGVTWRSPVTLDIGAERPAGVFLFPKGDLLCFELVTIIGGGGGSGTGTISRQPIKSDYESPNGSSVSTSLSFPVQYFGADRDRRDNVWLAAQKADSSLWVGYSDAYGEPWHEVI